MLSRASLMLPAIFTGMIAVRPSCEIWSGAAVGDVACVTTSGPSAEISAVRASAWARGPASANVPFVVCMTTCSVVESAVPVIASI